MSRHQHAPLRFNGAKGLVQRLVLATLTGRPVRIDNIRPASTSTPGLAPHEVSFIRLLEAITNGSVIEFSMTGTTVLYRPGLLSGSASGFGGDAAGVIKHEIPAECSRGVSFFLLPLCLLAPFSKSALNVYFTGAGVITSATPSGDVSVDAVRAAVLPYLADFGIQHNVELRILRRSCPGRGGKGGGGEVQVVFGHLFRLPPTIHLQNPGKVKRIRGVAYAVGLAGSNNARMIESARGILNEFVPDTYIYSEVSAAPTRPDSAPQSSKGNKKFGMGFGISLVAETSTGRLYSADVASPPEGGRPAEEVGEHCAYQLLEVISQGGCATRITAPLVLTFMAMGSNPDIGTIQLGKEVIGSESIIGLAKDLQLLGGSSWGLRESQSHQDEVVVSIVGNGVGNVGRKIA